MEIRTELKQVLRRLRLSGILFTLPERVSYARGQKLSYEEFLELVLVTRSRGGTREPSSGGYGRGLSTPTRRSRGSSGTSPSRSTGTG